MSDFRDVVSALNRRIFDADYCGPYDAGVRTKLKVMRLHIYVRLPTEDVEAELEDRRELDA